MKTCDFCGKDISTKKSNARFCHVNCRVKHYQHQEQLRLRQEPLLHAIEEHEQRKAAVVANQAYHQEMMQKAAKEMAIFQSKVQEKKELLSYSDDEFRNKFLGIRNVEEYCSAVKGNPLQDPLNQMQNLMHVWNEKAAIREDLLLLERQVKFCEQKFYHSKEQVSLHEEEIADVDQFIRKYQQQLEALNNENRQQAQVRKQRKQPQRATAGKKGVPLAEFMKMSFKTFTLSGTLGEFLGPLSRHQLSVALTGDPGAGKSYLLGALAQLLSLQQYSICYFQLELELENNFQDILRTYPMKARNIMLMEEATLEEVRASAASYDCILIDSFGKVSEDSKAFDALRKEFPETIFISIFQKNSQGQIRGGARIDFDSSMIIDVTRREGRPIAVMKKSRYGTQGWEYDVWAKKIIKRFDKTSIKSEVHLNK